MGLIFPRGNFRKEGHIAKNAKITPTRVFPRLQYLTELYMTSIFINTERSQN